VHSSLIFYDINTLTMTTKANVLMVGTGEYTTGYVDGKGADSDKSAGVVALAMFDLRRRGKVDRVGMCGVNVSISNLLLVRFCSNTDVENRLRVIFALLMRLLLCVFVAVLR
jgi:hypothetical protein